jgi:hypothetical protein
LKLCCDLRRHKESDKSQRLDYFETKFPGLETDQDLSHLTPHEDHGTNKCPLPRRSKKCVTEREVSEDWNEID